MAVEHASAEPSISPLVSQRFTRRSNPLTSTFAVRSNPFQQRVPLFQFPPPYRAETLEQDQTPESPQELNP